MLSQTSEYAMRAAVCLATTGGALTPVSELASRTGVPENYLSKVLQQLSAAGVVHGRRGVGGGYRLAQDPAQTTLLDVIAAIGKLDRRRGPTAQLSADGAWLGRLSTVLDSAVDSVSTIFARTSLADVAGSALSPISAAAVHTASKRTPLPRASAVGLIEHAAG